MGNLTIDVTLRIVTLIVFSLYIFTILYVDPSNQFAGPRIYIIVSFFIVLLLISIQQRQYKKSRPDGRIIMSEMILPEFNSEDERETELTGNAAKSAFSTILIYTPFAIGVFALLQLFDGLNTGLIALLAIISIPITGLIAYYFSYRHYFLK